MMQVLEDSWEHLNGGLYEVGKLNLVISPCGTGKTTSISSFLAESMSPGDSVVALTFRQTLATKLAHSLDCKNYLEYSDVKYISFADAHRLVISVESLRKLKTNGDSTSLGIPIPKFLILDEFCSLIEHAFNDSTLDAVRRKLFFNYIMCVLALDTVTTIVADAYLREEDITVLLAALSDTNAGFDEGRVKVIRNLYKGPARQVLYTHCFPLWKELLLEAITKGDERLYVFSNWKRILDGIQEECLDASSSIQSFPRQVASGTYYISSDSSHEQKMEGSQSPDRVWSDYKHVFCTPTVAAGISYDKKKHFQRAFGFCGQGSTSPLGSLQQLARVRSLEKKEVVLYCPTPAKKQVTYTDEMIRTALARSEKKVKRQYTECVEIGVRPNDDRTEVVSTAIEKSAINRFLVHLQRSDLEARQNYIGSLQRLCESTNYVFKKLPRKRRAKPSATDDRSSRGNSLSTVIKLGKKYRSEILCSSWDGRIDYDLYTVSPCLLALKEFLVFWNCFGAWGYYSDTKVYVSDNDDPANKELVLHPERASKFYSTFVADGKQDTFYEFYVEHAINRLCKDKSEYDMGSASQASLLYQLTMELCDVYNIAPKTQYTHRTWFQDEHELSLAGHVWSGIITAGRMSDEEVEQVTRIQSSLYMEYTEQDIAEEPTRCDLLRAILKRYWKPLYLAGLITNKHRSVFGSLEEGPSNASTPASIIHLGTDVLKRLLDTVGLPSREVSKKKANIAGDPSKRMEVKRYRIELFRERVLLCILRLLQKSGTKPIDTPHYPIPDPFHLLQNDPREYMTESTLRFSATSEPLWASLPDHWKDMCSPSGAINHEHFPWALDLIPASHAPCTIDKSIIYAMFWGVHNGSFADFRRFGLDSTRLPTATNVFIY